MKAVRNEYLRSAARLEARGIRYALSDPLVYKRCYEEKQEAEKTGQQLPANTYLLQHDGTGNVAACRAERYQPLLEGSSVCPICYVRAKKINRLTESRAETGVVLFCDVCLHPFAPPGMD